MKEGDLVRVFPHGKPEKGAIAKVAIISSNQCSIAVGFEEKPPFAILHEGFAFHPDHGIMLFAYREEIEGKPWGPWIEMFGGGHYEIEELGNEQRGHRSEIER